MAAFPYMPMYWGDYWRDTMHLSDAEHVSYLKLISHYWQFGGLPDDDARLCRIAGRSMDEWLVMKPMLQAFFEHSWKHRRIDKELAAQMRISEVNKTRAKRAADARWNARSNPQAMLGASSEQCLSNANHYHNQNIPIQEDESF